MDLNALYQELILDHGIEPRHCYCLEGATCIREGYNPLCGDRIVLYLKVENGLIDDASFQGKGCAISTASASLMAELMIGKTVEEARRLFNLFQALLTTENVNHEVISEESLADLGKLLAFTGVKAFPSRIKCATLPWHTLSAALTNEETIICTE